MLCAVKPRCRRVVVCRVVLCNEAEEWNDALWRDVKPRVGVEWSGVA